MNKSLIFLFLIFTWNCYAVPSTNNQQVEIQLIRNATVKLSINNHTLLIDPVLADAGDNAPIPFSDGRRNPLIELPISKENVIDNVDAVLITHFHPDHFDSTAANILPKDILIICQPYDVEAIQKLGFSKVNPLDSLIEWNEVTIQRYEASHFKGATNVPAFGHSSSYFIKNESISVFLTGDAILDYKLSASLMVVNPKVIIANTGECQFTQNNPILEPHKNMTLSKEEIKDISHLLPGSKIIAVHLEAINHCQLTRKELKKYITKEKLDKQVYIPFENEILTF